MHAAHKSFKLPEHFSYYKVSDACIELAAFLMENVNDVLRAVRNN